MLNGCQANRRYISKEIIHSSLLIAAISRAGIVGVLFLSAKRGTLPFFYDSLFYSRRFPTIRHINTEILLHVNCSYQCQVIQEVINVKLKLNNKRGLNFADLKHPNHAISTRKYQSGWKPKDQNVIKIFLGLWVKCFQKFLFILDYFSQDLYNWTPNLNCNILLSVQLLKMKVRLLFVCLFVKQMLIKKINSLTGAGMKVFVVTKDRKSVV